MPEESKQSIKCPVSGPISTLYRATQLFSFGLSPIQLKRKRDGHLLSLSPNSDKMKYLVIFVVFAINSYWYIMKKEAQKDHLVWRGLSIYLSLLTIFSIYGASSRLRSITQALNILQKINNSIGCPKNLEFEKKKSIAVLVGIIYILGFALLNPWTILRKNLITIEDCCFMFHFYQYVLLHMLNMEFALCALEVASVLRSINELLEYILRTNFQGIESVFIVKRPTKRMEETVHYLAVQYNEVCHAVGLLDGATGLVILIILISCFLHLVYVPYIVLTGISENLLNAWSGIWMSQWICIYLVWLLLLLEPCHKVQEEVNRANLTTCKLLTMCEDEMISKQLNKMCLNFILNNITFSPLGVCILSRDLLNAMLVSITTFLIIVVQFHKL